MYWKDKEEQDCMREGNKRKQLFSEKDADKTCTGEKTTRNNNVKYEER